MVGVTGDYTRLPDGSGTYATDDYEGFGFDYDTFDRTSEIGVAAGISSLWTLRARAGVAFDRLLVYGTGGLAYGQASISTYANIADTYVDAGKSETYDTYSATAGWAGGNSERLMGYAVGGGFEMAVAPRMSLQFEGLYYNLGRIGATATGTGAYTVDDMGGGGPGAPTPITVQPYQVETVVDGAIFKLGITFRP